MLNDPVVIGISPGSRFVGIAVLKGLDLKDVRIRVIVKGTSPDRIRKLSSYLHKLFKRYQPVAVALKGVRESHTSPLLDQVMEAIRRTVGESYVLLHEYSLERLKGEYDDSRMGNRYELARRVVLEFCLPDHPFRTSKWAREYHLRVVEAVAAAKVCTAMLAEKGVTQR